MAVIQRPRSASAAPLLRVVHLAIIRVRAPPAPSRHSQQQAVAALFAGEKRTLQITPVDAYDGPFAEVEAASRVLGDLGHGYAAGSSRADDSAAALLHCKLNAM